MLKLITFFIVLIFPILEIFLLIQLTHIIGWWLVLWLLCSAVLGIALIREERVAFAMRIIQSLHNGQSLLTAVLQSGRLFLAGVLLILPGVISDVLALILILLPQYNSAKNPRQDPQQSVIEGEFKRDDT